MAGRKTLLTPEVHKKIVDYTRAGAFAWVAAQACGVDPSTFRRWMRYGQNPKSPYYLFCTQVKRAQAEARVLAEAEVRNGQAFQWLRYGPGRERPGEPGWTESKEITGAGGGTLRLIIVEEIVDARFTGEDTTASSASGIP